MKFIKYLQIANQYFLWLKVKLFEAPLKFPTFRNFNKKLRKDLPSIVFLTLGKSDDLPGLPIPPPLVQ